MKVLVGLSGGVDSAMAAKLLLDKGYDVTGVTMRLLSPLGTAEKNNRTYPLVDEKQERDIQDAKAVAEKLGIKHIVYDFREIFRKKIINYFIEEYKKGRTPNPCFICNREIKTGLLLERALQEGFDFISTGHYAEIEKSSLFGQERFLLKKGSDNLKDQSYFLALLNQHRLSHILFPLAEISKKEVRSRAESAGLLNAHRPDSQDICFVPDDDYTNLINSIAPDFFPKGNFLDIYGNKIGTHKGLQYYTIGQRRGLGIAMGYPIYVVEKNAVNNTVTVGTNDSLFAKSLIAENVNFIAFDKPEKAMDITVKTRYRQIEKKAKLIPVSEETVKIEFLEPERAVAEGQAVVFYSEAYVLGGGIIKTVERII